MIIKRICCKVKINFKEVFHEHQKQWEQLKNIQGFIGQVGGWDFMNSYSAIIYSFWRSHKDYQSFMSNVHDQIFINSGQEDTYHSIEVNLFEQHLNNSEEESNLKDMLSKSHTVTVALRQLPNDSMVLGEIRTISIGKGHTLVIISECEEKAVEHSFAEIGRERFIVEEEWRITVGH